MKNRILTFVLALSVFLLASFKNKPANYLLPTGHFQWFLHTDHGQMKLESSSFSFDKVPNTVSDHIAVIHFNNGDMVEFRSVLVRKGVPAASANIQLASGPGKSKYYFRYVEAATHHITYYTSVWPYGPVFTDELNNTISCGFTLHHDGPPSAGTLIFKK